MNLPNTKLIIQIRVTTFEINDCLHLDITTITRMTSLPNEMLLKIFNYLEYHDLLMVREVHFKFESIVLMISDESTLTIDH